jgi:uncharacterized membrane protein
MNVFDKGLITILVCNAVFILVSVPLVFGWVPRNPIYGYRTRTTLDNDAVWYKANAYFGLRFAIACLVSMASAAVLYRWQGLEPLTYLQTTVVLLAVPVAVGVWLTQRYIRRIAAEYPASKTGTRKRR